MSADDNDLIFSLDEDHVVPENSIIGSGTPNSSALHSALPTGSLAQRQRPRSPLRARVHTLHKHRHVIPNGIEMKQRICINDAPVFMSAGTSEGEIRRGHNAAVLHAGREDREVPG